MTRSPAPTVRLVICGNPDRGDDGVAHAAAAELLATLPAAVRRRVAVRRCPELRVEDVVDLGPEEVCVILDAVSGVDPGRIVVMPIDRLPERVAFTPRSSHQLPLPLVLGIAAALRDRPLDGVFVGLAGHRWGHGEPLSPAVREALPAYRATIEAALLRHIMAPATVAAPAVGG